MGSVLARSLGIVFALGFGAWVARSDRYDSGGSDSRQTKSDERRMPRAGAPNVVSIVVAASDRDSWSGYAERGYAPFIATLAAKGVVFEDAIATSTHGPLATAGMSTGTVHLARDDGWSVPIHMLTIAERFQAAGWQTLGVGVAPGRADIARRGFDRFRPLTKRREGRQEALVVQQVLKFLENRPADSGRPLFVQVVITTPREVGERARMRDIDRSLKVLHRGLASRGLTTENTLFSVASDAPGGAAGGSFTVQQARIPWVLWGAGVSAARHGESVSGADVAPTLLGLAGIEGPRGDGVDLSRWVDGRAPPSAREEVVFTGPPERDPWVGSADPKSFCTRRESAPNDVRCVDRATSRPVPSPPDGVLPRWRPRGGMR